MSSAALGYADGSRKPLDDFNLALRRTNLALPEQLRNKRDFSEPKYALVRVERSSRTSQLQKSLSQGLTRALEFGYSNEDVVEKIEASFLESE